MALASIVKAVDKLDNAIEAFSSAPVSSDIARYYDDPVGFAEDCILWRPGEGLTDYQAESLRALVSNHRVAERGPHGLGKTMKAAIVVHWFALTREAAGVDWKLVSTASAWLQLTHYLWPEIHKWAHRLNWEVIGRKPYNASHELLKLQLSLRFGSAFAVASSDPERIEGAHAESLLYLFDEAKIIPDEVFDSAEGAFSSAGSDTVSEAFALAISTPGAPTGRFYDIHSRKRGLTHWWVKHVTLDDTLRAGRVSRAWAESSAELWGRGSAIFKNRVLGEFAVEDEQGVIPLSWVEAAQNRWGELEAAGALRAQGFTCVGADVGDTGPDATVLALRYGDVVAELRTYQTAETMETTGHIASHLRTPDDYAVVDGIGIGAGVVSRLSEQAYNVVSFVASARATSRDRSGQLQFFNRRAEAWWKFRELLDPANTESLALPPSETLTADLVTPHWRMMSNGKILIESKDEIRKRLGRSTNEGDAVVMAFHQSAMELDMWGLLTCDSCGEFYNADPSGKPRPCPYCSGQQRRWRPAPGPGSNERYEEAE